MDLFQNTITYYKPETINIFGVQYGKKQTADKILQKRNDPEILDIRYILRNAKSSDIVAVIKEPSESRYSAKVDCVYKSFHEWCNILTQADTHILPQKIPDIECSSDKDYFDIFECLLKCEIDTTGSQLGGVPGTGTKWPMKRDAKKKIFPYLGDYEI
ncbi:MAG: hypothetical protein U9Q92_01245 [archaeon]|nr:hypothetical protein [archaeon]